MRVRLFLPVCSCVGVQALCVLQGSIKLTELETSDRAKDHVVHIPSIHPHSHISRVS